MLNCVLMKVRGVIALIEADGWYSWREEPLNRPVPAYCDATSSRTFDDGPAPSFMLSTLLFSSGAEPSEQRPRITVVSRH